MPKYRKLHVKTTESLDINDMPDDFTRLMWVLLPLGLCREGRGIDNPAWIKSKLFPLRVDVTQEMIDTAMDWYVQRGMIIRYQVDGRAYFHLPTFHKYQGSTTKEAESDYPPPPEQSTDYSRVTPELLQSKSSTDSVFSIQYSDADADAEGGADAPEPPATPPRKEKQPAPEPVQVFRDAVHRYPPKAWYDEIAGVVGNDPPALKRWHRVCHSWVGLGWNPQNVKGMLECYQRNEIPGENGSRAPPVTGSDATLEALRIIERRMQNGDVAASE